MLGKSLKEQGINNIYPKEKEKLLDILDSTIDIFLGNNKNG